MDDGTDREGYPERVIEAAASYRTATQAARTLDDAWAASWADGTRRIAYDRFYDLRASAPVHTVDADRWMLDNHPEETAACLEIERASAHHAEARANARLAGSQALGSALGALGDHWGNEIAMRISEDATRIPFEEVRRAYVGASAFRQSELDGGKLVFDPWSFDPDGAFTVGLYRALGAAKGMPTKGKGWIADVAERASQPAYVTVTCRRGGLEALRANGVVEVERASYMSGEGEDARFALTIELRHGSSEATLALLRSGSDIFEVEGPFVADPHFRFPNTRPDSDSLLDRPADELDDAERDGRAASVEWALQASRSPTSRDKLRAILQTTRAVMAGWERSDEVTP